MHKSELRLTRAQIDAGRCATRAQIDAGRCTTRAQIGAETRTQFGAETRALGPVPTPVHWDLYRPKVLNLDTFLHFDQI